MINFLEKTFTSVMMQIILENYVDFFFYISNMLFFLNSEFLSKNSPKEINVDSKTLEIVNKSREEMRGKPESMRSVTQ